MKKLLTILVFITSICKVSAQCTFRKPTSHIIPAQSGGTEIYNPSSTNWLPGDTLFIPGGTYDVIQFAHTKGSACQYLHIKAAPNATVHLSGRFALEQLDSFIEVDGTNIYVNGVVGGAEFTNVILENFDITNPAGVAIFIKENSDSTNYYSYYPHYTQRNIIIRNNHIHNTGGEGMYIGSTDPNGDDQGQSEKGYPPTNMDSVEVYGNTTDSTGWDGIQVSNAQHASIHDNHVSNFGLVNKGSQQAGIIFGGNTTGSVYNNTVRQGTGNGIQVFGYGNISVYNNIVDTTGHDFTPNGQQSFFSNQYNLSLYPLTFNQTISITNNTFASIERISVIRAQNDGGNSTNATAISNKICAPNVIGSPIILDPVGSSQSGNIFSCDQTVLDLVPPVPHVYQTIIALNTLVIKSTQIQFCKLFDMQGNKLLSQLLNIGTNYIPLSKYSDGIYIFKAENMDVKKIIKLSK